MWRLIFITSVFVFTYCLSLAFRNVVPKQSRPDVRISLFGPDEFGAIKQQSLKSIYLSMNRYGTLYIFCQLTSSFNSFLSKNVQKSRMESASVTWLRIAGVAVPFAITVTWRHAELRAGVSNLRVADAGFTVVQGKKYSKICLLYVTFLFNIKCE